MLKSLISSSCIPDTGQTYLKAHLVDCQQQGEKSYQESKETSKSISNIAKLFMDQSNQLTSCLYSIFTFFLQALLRIFSWVKKS